MLGDIPMLHCGEMREIVISELWSGVAMDPSVTVNLSGGVNWTIGHVRDNS